LLEALQVNQTTQRWSTGFTDTCALNNATASANLNCKANDFNYTSNAANVTLTNNFKGAVRLNTASCYMPGVMHNTSVNQTVGAGASYTFVLPCYSVPFGYASAQTSYTFAVNYTQNGTQTMVYGLMNITNFG
ncbi:MAG: hypothetical protein ACREBW_01875, partial [Candidatus Micrarchaeaceae archaeon]